MRKCVGNKIRFAPQSNHRAMHSLIMQYLHSIDKYIVPISNKSIIPYMDMRYKSTGFHSYDDECCSENIWDNYFIQDEIDDDERFYMEYVFDHGLFFLSSELVKRYNHASVNYLKYRPRVISKIEEFTNSHFNGKSVAGIHIRGTDTFFDSTRPHLPVRYYVEFIERNLKDYDVILLCTDQQETFEFFKSRYPNKVVGYNSHRRLIQDSEIALHKKADDPYKSGEDVLIESQLMSKCNLLIRPHSNMTTCSYIQNPKLILHQVDAQFWNKGLYGRSVKSFMDIFNGYYNEELELPNLDKYVELSNKFHRKLVNLRGNGIRSKINEHVLQYLTNIDYDGY